MTTWRESQLALRTVVTRTHGPASTCCGMYCAQCLDCVLTRRTRGMSPMECTCTQAAEVSMLALTIECSREEKIVVIQDSVPVARRIGP